MYVTSATSSTVGPSAGKKQRPPDKLLKHPPDKVVLLEEEDSAPLMLVGGSDGETSDYQRSTPSPRDSETSSEDKLEEDHHAVCWKDGGLADQRTSAVGRGASTVSPDLGFVDCSDVVVVVPDHLHPQTNNTADNGRIVGGGFVGGNNAAVKSPAPQPTTLPKFVAGNGTSFRRDKKTIAGVTSSLAKKAAALAATNSSSPPQLPKSLLLNKQISVQVQKLPKTAAVVAPSPRQQSQQLVASPPFAATARFGAARTNKGIVMPSRLIAGYSIAHQPAGPKVSNNSDTSGINKRSCSNSSSSINDSSSSSSSNAKFVPTKIFYNQRGGSTLPSSQSQQHNNIKKKKASETKNLVSSSSTNNESEEAVGRRMAASPRLLTAARKFVAAATAASAPSSECGSEHSSSSSSEVSSAAVSRSQSPAPHQHDDDDDVVEEDEEGNALLSILSCSSSAGTTAASSPAKASHHPPSSSEIHSADSNSSSCISLPPLSKPDTVAASSSSSGVSSAGSEAAAASRPFRFPTLVADRSAIPCKWEDCGQGFKSHARLSDHIKTVHMLPQLVMPDDQRKDYCCLWQGCKVYGAKSSSASWLQKHVPLHGGKLTFPCIVEGCKNRFSSQLMLERHVNSHFPENGASSGSGSGQAGARKSTESVPARSKVLKRAGVKLKFRKLPFSARIFDFFDAGIMAGIRHQVCSLQEKSRELGIQGDDPAIQFTSTALSLRLGESGRREVQLRWSPEDLLPDEWVPLDSGPPATRSVKLSQLPEAAKNRLQQQLHLGRSQPPTFTKHPRKRKAATAASIHRNHFQLPEEGQPLVKRSQQSQLAANLFM